MKKKLLLLFFVFIACAGMAQEVMPKDEFIQNARLYGLYNNRTNRWVVQPKYQRIDGPYSYNGVYYYMVQASNGLYGLINSKNYNEFCVKPIYTYMLIDYFARYVFNNMGIIGVKKGSDWGILEVVSGKYLYVFQPQYQRISWNGSDGSVAITDWNNNGTNYLPSEVKAKRDAKIAEAYRAEEKAKREAQLAQEAKEKELASFTLYAQKYISPRIIEWQQKGEFEKMADYETRVTGSNREAKIKELQLQAEELFIKEHSALNPFSQLVLHTYDSENEVFAITTKFGKLLLPVPIAEGETFKQHFTSLEKRNVRYYIQDDKLTIREMDFYDPATKKSYHYTNNNALNYEQYIINPDELGLPVLNVQTGKTVSSQTMQKPKVHILSPSRDNMQYENSEVIFRIDVTAGEGTMPQLYVQIAGGIAQPVTPLPEPKANKKGATVVTGKQYAINLPTDKVGAICNVSFYAKDEQGFVSETTQPCPMRYTGIQTKPNLHLMAVGVSDYQSASLSKLNYAARDAADFVATIQQSNLSDYQSLKTKLLLTNASATKKDIEYNLNKLSQNARQGDVVMLFLSGHGVIMNGSTYFMGIDSETNNPFSAVGFSQIKELLSSMTERGVKVVLFMDACHSGAMNKKGTRSLVTMDEASIIGFYSSAANEESMETQKLQNGVFTNALLKGLNGAAAENGEISTTSLQNYLEKAVDAESHGQQHPIVENKVGNVKLFNIKK